jgi:hypothetical protein
VFVTFKGTCVIKLFVNVFGSKLECLSLSVTSTHVYIVIKYLVVYFFETGGKIK